MKCPECNRSFPFDLVSELTVATTVLSEPGRGATVEQKPMCPICARKAVNKACDLPPDTPFSEIKARIAYNRAVAHLKATNQEMP